MPNSPSQRPVRILQVVGRMNRGGVETWLLHLLRHADRSRLAMDFLVHTEEPGAYDPEVLALGAHLIRCLRPDRPLRYAKNLWRVLRRYGPYDVVHSHVHHYTGWVLSIAVLARVPMRISHSHSDTSNPDRRSSATRGMYLSTMQSLVRRSATAGFSCTAEAAVALYGDSWQRDLRWSVLRYGIDLNPFRAPPQSSLRAKLGISGDSFVIGHVGRFVDVKNQAFIVAIAQAAASLAPKMHFLLVGDGPLREDVIHRVAELGLSSRFTFADPRSDVPALMTGAMDCFLLPSLHEGLPLVLVEAQAAGLPCLVSDTVSPESRIADGPFCWESLRSSPQVWLARLLELRSLRTAGESAVRALEGGPFDVRANLQRLEAFYLQRQPSSPAAS